MGAAVGVLGAESGHESELSATVVPLKKLPDAVEEAIYVHEKFPLVIDKSEQASRFFKYQTGAFISSEDPIMFTKSSLNRALVSSFLNGRTFTVRFPTLENLSESMFHPNDFPVEVVDRSKFFLDAVWQKLLKPSDPPLDEASIKSEFVFIVCTATDYVPPLLRSLMHVITVADPSQQTAESGGKAGAVLTSGDEQMDQIASMFGATEIIRNSIPLVEAAFDGDLDEMVSQIDKGYHLESFDGRKHTALSEAASQGHMHVVQALLERGADPNALSDTGRSPLWRAAFNGHLPIVQVLLEAGASPEFRDKVSMESAYDVANTEEVRQFLEEWDMAKTERLMEQRRRIILQQLEARIKTSAEREAFARNVLRKELVEKAEAGDVEGIKQLLHMVIAEGNEQVKKQGEGAPFRPRATVEVRNDLGQSLLSIAAQRDDVVLAEFLLTYWKTLDADRWDLTEGEVSPEAKVFKPNVNGRDLKGWTCVAIAVFHEAKKVLPLLLEHGGNPNIRSSYNKSAWDLAKDEVDAAERVVKSHAEIRQILIDYDRTQKLGPSLFAKGDVVKSGEDGLYADLDKDGTAMVMNVEFNKEQAKEGEEQRKKESESKKDKGKGGRDSGGKGKSGGGGKKKAGK